MSRENNFSILFQLTINLKRVGSSLEDTSSDAINMKTNETQKKRYNLNSFCDVTISLFNKKSGGKFMVMRTDYDCEYTKENARRTVNTVNNVSNYAIALKIATTIILIIIVSVSV